eukprot:TRINITY_DN24836_c0_g1_i1.p1 TRINITY_DN24836_c0_g1~~TRINITY_DN24836_c0_g1_i1.p1  ORF type:complete len:426 (+),score=66.58 TRINITY_DN24836_c0_g1_i1:57-1334(+)
MAAELVETSLRTAVQTARARYIRCLKAAVATGAEASGSDPAPRSLVLAGSVAEEGGALLEKEFLKSVQELIEDGKPCLLLFRADTCENIDGSRWVLLTWLPPSVSETERSIYIRSRSLLSDLVAQQYFLSEHFVSKRSQLAWTSISAAQSSSSSKRDDKMELSKAQRPPSGECSVEAPLRHSSALQGLLQRLANREDSCLRLLINMRDLSSLDSKETTMIVPLLEAKVLECRSPAQLAKGDLPSAAAFFALCSREDLLFIHWCPDRVMTRDTVGRMREDARYAVLKASVLKTVLAAFPAPGPRLLQVDARDPQELVDNANKAADAAALAEAAGQGLMPGAISGYSAEGASPEAPWPAKGAPADWPLDWPAEATRHVRMPASLSLPARPVPWWRGGSKTTSFSSGPSASTSTTRSKLMRSKYQASA